MLIFVWLEKTQHYSINELKTFNWKQTQILRKLHCQFYCCLNSTNQLNIVYTFKLWWPLTKLHMGNNVIHLSTFAYKTFQLYVIFNLWAKQVYVNVLNYIRCRWHNSSNRGSNSKVKFNISWLQRYFPC